MFKIVILQLFYCVLFFTPKYMTYKPYTFPILTPTLFLTGTAIYITGKPKSKDDSTSFISYMQRSSNFLLNFVTKKREIPILPPQSTKKPVIIFDVNDFIFKKSFSFLNFTNIYYKRSFTNVFLFHLAHLYELILVSEMNANESEKLLQKIDPYGCISYRLFLNDKIEFKQQNLNRDMKQTVYIDTKLDKLSGTSKPKAISTNPSLSDFNKITIEKWNGQKDDKLLTLLDFFIKLRHSKINDYKKVTETYKNKELIEFYTKKQKEKYRKSHLFSWNINKMFQNNCKQINNERIRDFERAKIEMDQHIKRDELVESKRSIGTRLVNFVMSIL